MIQRRKNPGREIVFDTETTGFDAKGDDRITEIGCIELMDYLPTGKTFHQYCDPLREVPERVVEITGLTTEFLTGKPLFKDIAQDFLDFIGDAPLIAHNSDFDRGFVNAELMRADFKPISDERFVDTLKMARAQFPGSPATLDALCKRFDISLASRDTHGAITDSILLAEVYLELSGGRARRLGLDDLSGNTGPVSARRAALMRPSPWCSRISNGEKEAHDAFIAELGDGSVWRKFRRS